MWVIFEGLDKVGKGTLEKEFLKAVDYKHIVIDRGPIGYITFDWLFNRETVESNENFLAEANFVKSSNNFAVVYCSASEEVVKERLKAHGETLPYDFESAHKFYRRNVLRYYNPERTWMLDTSKRSVDECVQLIVKFVKNLEEGNSIHEL